MSVSVRITEDAQKVALIYGPTVSQGIVNMNDFIRKGGNLEATLRKIVQEEGVNLHPTTKQAFQNLNRTLVEVISAHNKV